VPIGGSTKGTTLAFGQWGIRIKGNGARLTQKQLLAAEDAVRRKIKPIKGAKVYLRVFPDIPVCIKVSTPLRYNPRLFNSRHCVREMRHVWVRVRVRSNSGRLGEVSCSVHAAFNVNVPLSVPPGRVIMEIGGTPVREELARDGTFCLTSICYGF
jgi:ribosomal protein L16/L10AE